MILDNTVPAIKPVNNSDGYNEPNGWESGRNGVFLFLPHKRVQVVGIFNIINYQAYGISPI